MGDESSTNMGRPQPEPQNSNSSQERSRQGSQSGLARETSPPNESDNDSDSKPQVPMQKRRRVTRACDECRRKKIKCDGKQPCTHCTVYSYGTRTDQAIVTLANLCLQTAHTISPQIGGVIQLHNISKRSSSGYKRRRGFSSLFFHRLTSMILSTMLVKSTKSSNRQSLPNLERFVKISIQKMTHTCDQWWMALDLWISMTLVTTTIMASPQVTTLCAVFAHNLATNFFPIPGPLRTET